MRQVKLPSGDVFRFRGNNASLVKEDNINILTFKFAQPVSILPNKEVYVTEVHYDDKEIKMVHLLRPLYSREYHGEIQTLFKEDGIIHAFVWITIKEQGIRTHSGDWFVTVKADGNYKKVYLNGPYCNDTDILFKTIMRSRFEI